MLDDIFGKYTKRVKANVGAPKDAKGITRKVKLTVAPAGAIDDDAEWIEAASGGVTITESMKTESGHTRSKSLQLSGEDEEEQTDSVQVTERVLGIKEAPKKAAKKRTGKADTVSANGKHEQAESSAS